MGTIRFTVTLPDSLSGEVSSSRLQHHGVSPYDQQVIVKAGNGTRPTIVPVGPSAGRQHQAVILIVGSHAEMRAEVDQWFEKKAGIGTLSLESHNGLSTTYAPVTLLDVQAPYPWPANLASVGLTFLEA